MKIVDKALLKEFSTPGRCERCQKFCEQYRHPHHIFSRGAGRLDIRINLISLCFLCHARAHGKVNGVKISHLDFLAVVAMREKTTTDAIWDEVCRLRREPK